MHENCFTKTEREALNLRKRTPHSRMNARRPTKPELQLPLRSATERREAPCPLPGCGAPSQKRKAPLALICEPPFARKAARRRSSLRVTTWLGVSCSQGPQARNPTWLGVSCSQGPQAQTFTSHRASVAPLPLMLADGPLARHHRRVRASHMSNAIALAAA